MNPKAYLILAIISFIGVVAAFIFFIATIASDGFYSGDSTVSDIMITIFTYLGLVMLFVFLGVFFLIKYAKANNYSAQSELTKKCISCGTVIGITEMSCPRCFTLQPPGGSSPSIFRRK
jgi:hypothetical protein